jgi:hypothetical protein
MRRAVQVAAQEEGECFCFEDGAQHFGLSRSDEEVRPVLAQGGQPRSRSQALAPGPVLPRPLATE